MVRLRICFIVLILIGISGCQSFVSGSAVEMAAPSSGGLAAHVQAVDVQGNVQNYQFEVTISSPDEGCQQYADWWEVLTEDGDLIYRRVLLHSHVGEQPFTRSGGPVAVDAATSVIIRVHMHPDGYGGQAMKGSVQIGFEPFTVEEGFGFGVEQLSPLPEDCAF